jgi:hypothetical protein
MKRFSIKNKFLVTGVLSAALFFSGCGSSDSFVLNQPQPQAPPIPAPVAVDDAFNALGNATLNRAATGVLANDTVNGAVIDSFDAVGSNGGAIVLNADGSFTYTPVFGFVGAETFTYTLLSEMGNSTATVTMTSTGLGHFVDNTAAPGGNGSQASPFDTLAGAIAVANAGDTIFVARGDGTNTGLAGAVNLPNGVDLIGEGTGLILAQTIVPQGQAPTLTGPITCNGLNTVSGLIVDGSGTVGIIISGVADVTVSNNTFQNNPEEHIDIDNGSGTITISNNTLEPLNDDFIDVDNTDTNATFVLTNNTFNDDNSANPDQGVEFDIEGTTVATVTITGNAFNSGSNSDNHFEGIRIDSDDTSQLTFTIDNNAFDNVNDAVEIDGASGTSTQNGSFSGNTVTDSDDTGFDAEINGTATIANNTITDSANDGLELDAEIGATATFIVSNNQITGSGDDAVDASDDDNMNLALRNNTLTGSGDQALETIMTGTSNACYDIIDNIVDDDMFFDDETTGSFDVERAVDAAGTGLLTVNTFNAGTVIVDSGAINPVAAGACAIP